MAVNHLEAPIIINEKHEIIDGQHRKIAQEELELPITFIINEGYYFIYPTLGSIRYYYMALKER